MTSRVLGVLGLISAGFALFILTTSNPFERLWPAAADGRDLNPLLQDPALAIHPPMLYTGYVGMSVPFAFAVAAMLEGKLDSLWARWVRPWTTVAWVFLTVGIALGSWWAYYELGWGGWWFWDPVENASFMPWLVGTALIHSLAVTEKRGLFKSWTLLLAITAFSLSLLGTFLVRSGVVESVHAFASDPARGLFILVFLVICIGGALVLYAWRAPLFASNAGFAPVSRESFLLLNNVLLVAATAVILLGTLYPMFLDAFDLRQDLGRAAVLQHRCSWCRCCRWCSCSRRACTLRGSARRSSAPRSCSRVLLLAAIVLGVAIPACRVRLALGAERRRHHRRAVGRVRGAGRADRAAAQGTLAVGGRPRHERRALRPGDVHPRRDHGRVVQAGDGSEPAAGAERRGRRLRVHDEQARATSPVRTTRRSRARS